MANAFEHLNWLAILVSGLSAFFIGGIWYGPLFGKAWMAEFGFTEEDLKQRNMSQVFGISILLAIFAAFNLAMFIGPESDVTFGAMAGFLAGLGWVATMTGIQYLFEMKTLRLFLINAGYSTIALTVMGLILGAW